MLSNKLTFSLVLVLMFAFVATSAIAQTPVEIGEPAKGKFSVAAENPGGTTNTGVATDFNELNGIGLLDPAVEDVAFLQDLATILNFGGSIELLLLAGVDDTFTVRTDDGNVTSDDDIAALKHKILISEVMWAQNRSGTDAAGMMAAQWVEVYNHNLELKAGDALSLLISTAKPDRAPGAKLVIGANTYAVLDQVSTVNRFGSRWVPPGQNGNTARIGDLQDPDHIPPTNLVSMYRVMNLDGAAVKDKDGLPDGLKDGDEAGAWAMSAGTVNMRGYFVGSPGSIHVTPTGTIISFTANPASFATTGVILNEVRNDTSEANLDWIELYHNNDADDAVAQNIQDYEITLVTAADKDEVIVTGFPKFKLQPDTYLVIYNRDPNDTILAGGVSIQDIVDRDQVNKGASHLYFVADDLNLPDSGKFLIVLRSAKGKKGKPDNAIDYVGNGFYPVDSDTNRTDVHPFIGWAEPNAGNFTDNSFADASHSWARNTVLNDMGVYRPESTAARNEKWAKVPHRGGTGYDRDVDLNSAPGTPGYANVAINVISDDRDNEAKKVAYAFGGSITISEVMYDSRQPRDLVQWIELYNDSPDMAVDIGGWGMEIRNIADGKVESYVDSGFEFDAHTKILPNQTLLLVSRTGPSSVPRTRVYDLNQRHRKELGLQRGDKVLLSSEGFFIELKAKIMENGRDEMMTVDTAGNLMVEGATRTKQWDLPPADNAGARASIVRQYDAGAAADGSMEDSWKVFDFLTESYYGHRDDAGTPGFRRGGPLPVSLSSFRPVRDKATGQVVITWVTESELNNAGFNILRSETKTGEFKVINLQGIIAGHGTTSEKHVYSYIDKTAKPNVSYYYQIEDVSLNGNRTTLRTTHMRGNVNASGKLTTRWSELKSSDR